ncbi:MAG TPA: high-affinity nickel-transport family protein, partial [Verrucomicrobiae bacterium]|nr:high-affinity nickel-transport family protein [Verrucomicrobiae bacterium]
MRHATDADHVVAVTTIVSREQTVRNAALIGIVWGIGHTLTLLLAGGAIVLFGLVVPPRLGLSLEFSVGIMLVALGILNFRSFTRWLGNAANANSVPAECGYAHAHPHRHPKDDAPTAWFDFKFGRLGFYQSLRPLVVGIVHGLAGSAAVALLVLPLIQKPAWAIAYLL